MEAALAQFAAVGLADRVHFLVQEPDTQDGKRGCFHSHQQAARRALELGAQRALMFEDDVEFTPNFTPFAAARAARFLQAGQPWELFFLGHFPRKMELTSQSDVVKVRSMDGHAYVLSPAGMRSLCALEYRGDQVPPTASRHVAPFVHRSDMHTLPRCRWMCTTTTSAPRPLRSTRWSPFSERHSVTPRQSIERPTGMTTSWRASGTSIRVA